MSDHETTTTGDATTDDAADGVTPAPAPAFGRKVRVALLVDSLVQTAWVERIVRTIGASDYAEVVLVVRNTPEPVAPAAAPAPGRLRRLWENRDKLLYAAFERFDARQRDGADPFQPRDLRPHLQGVPVLAVTPRRTKHCDYFEEADVEAILAHDVDVAVRLGFRILKGRSLQVARHGVWSYHHGDNNENRGGPPGFWEVLENEPVTGSILQVLTEELDAGRVLYRSYASTNRFSVVKNKQNFYWKTAAFLPRKLRELHRFGPDALRAEAPDVPTPYSRRLYMMPGTRELAGPLARLVRRRVAERLRARTHLDQWMLFFRLVKRPSRPSVVPDLSPHRFVPLVPPPDRFWADPFPARVGDRAYILFEELMYATGKGHISMVEVDARGIVGEPERVLEREFHLSYPFLFEWRNEWYMIPESVAARRVELYRAVEFPRRWEPVAVLLDDVRAVDATLHEADGRWWMFVNVAEPDASSWDELHVYHAPSPLGPWVPHERNPVKSDVRSARPAGRPFSMGGRLYRPAQDCSWRYGYAIALNRVDVLTPHEYEETVVGRVKPEWRRDLIATHTVNAMDGLTVIDGMIRRPR